MPAAQFLLSMIAPAAPAAPQGSTAGADVTADFQGLLAGMMGAVAPATDGETTDAPPARPSRTGFSADTEIQAEAPDAAPAGFLAAPAPTPLVQPASPDGEVATTGAKDGAPVQPPVPETLPPQSKADQVAGDGRVVQPTAETGKGASDPQVQPPAQDGSKDGAQTQPLSEDAPAPPAAGAEAAAKAVADVAAGIARPDAPRPAVQPVEPAPLRPLPDRTSKPLDSAARDAAAEIASPASAPEAPVAASVDAAAPAAEAPVRPAEAPAAAAQGSADTAAEDTSTEGAPAPDAPTQTAHAAVARDATPVLSRAAIDATAQIAAQILKKLDGRTTRFEMSLTPDELGRVDVKLDIDAEGRLAARLAFDNPAAAADLKGRADELRRQLEQQGFHLAEDAFEFAERDSGSSAFDRGQDARHGQARFSAAAHLNTQADVAVAAPRWTAHSLSPSGVDLKV